MLITIYSCAMESIFLTHSLKHEGEQDPNGMPLDSRTNNIIITHIYIHLCDAADSLCVDGRGGWSLIRRAVGHCVGIGSPVGMDADRG